MMDFKLIFTYWHKSSSIFSQANLKLYLLGTLATWIRAIKILATLFWWLFLAWVFMLFILSTSVFAQETNSYTWLYFPILAFPDFFLMLIEALIFYVMIMTLRPSLEIKNYTYYVCYARGLWVFVLFPIATFAYTFLLPILFLMLLFFFDSDLSVISFFQACKYTGKTLVYFFPLIAIMTIIATITMFLSKELIETACLFFSDVNYALVAATGVLLILLEALIVFVYAGITVLYTKLRHEYFNLLLQ